MISATEVQIKTPMAIPSDIMIDPSEKFLISSNFASANCSTYTINSDGTLTDLAAPTLTGGTSTNSIPSLATINKL